MVPTASTRKRGRVYKGERVQTTVRIPVEHYGQYMKKADEIGVPIADYVVYRIALCEGLPVPEQALRSYPRLILMYDADERAEVLAGLPCDLAAKIRRALHGEPAALPEVGMLPLLSDELSLTG